ncbi:hypothetical protein FVB32_01005 [Flagellimonas hymeniacidonis]|uniref:DUF6371 domain-containing protein n=1 Tax=Flagellimonas hymeniacidonis TaxID=2603628 RepID=A0A5C8V670_9FLAO|nr:DUF6371 domain-containing protein [Flagellimonas hymeniacidonis]TXN36896.1 hypothetical protein FVB32_01005 [Flagellimonas hymeniacidonis]
MNRNLEFDRNRKRVKYCPCGRSNRNQRFVPFKGYENYGYCHSCEKTFFEKNTEKHYIPQYGKSIKPLGASYHDKRLIVRYGRNYIENNFIQYLKLHFNISSIKEAILKYCIGTPKHWKGDTVFWQIDRQNNLRHGKIMLYDQNTGKRVKKNGRAYITSVRSMNKLEDFNLKQCLFGLHLINESKNKLIALVEGEKTAIMMSIFKPEYTWMATGSKQGFKESYLEPIKDCDIVAFPDNGEYCDWKNRAFLLNQKGYKIKVDDWFEKQEGFEKGVDLADVLIEMGDIGHKKGYNSNHNRITSTKLVQTIVETKVKKMALRNRAILTLITEFDLIDQNGMEIRI